MSSHPEDSDYDMRDKGWFLTKPKHLFKTNYNRKEKYMLEDYIDEIIGKPLQPETTKPVEFIIPRHERTLMYYEILNAFRKAGWMYVPPSHRDEIALNT